VKLNLKLQWRHVELFTNNIVIIFSVLHKSCSNY